MKVENLILYPLKLSSAVTGVDAFRKTVALSSQHQESSIFKAAFGGLMWTGQVLFPYSTNRLLRMLEDLNAPDSDLFTLKSTPGILGDLLSSSLTYALATSGHLEQAAAVKLAYNTLVNIALEAYDPVRRFFSRKTAARLQLP